MIRVIGDIHGKIGPYRGIIAGAEKSVQIGDFGVGFLNENRSGYIVGSKNPQHRFIRGNHDNPVVAKNAAGFIPDGTLEDGIMYIGGAYSIDRQYRTEGIDWWADEECSQDQFYSFMHVVERDKPRVMITHDCPESVIPWLFPRALPIKSRTQQALDAILGIHQPELWVFGHWHESRRVKIDGTLFVCLAELEYMDLEL